MSLKEILEELEIGENKEKLSKSDIKTIMAQSGKVVNAEVEKVKNEYTETINDLKAQIEKAPKTDEIESLKTKIADFEKKEAERVAEEDRQRKDKLLNESILGVFGDKKFTSEYAKNGLMNDIKKELDKEDNKGKGIKEIFEELTKDATGIFANPNVVPDMPSMGDIPTEKTKEDFQKMSYKERVELKAQDPELFAKLNG